MPRKSIRLLIEGGRATQGPPIGSALSPLGLNLAEVVKAINDATKDFEGLTVPVEVVVDTESKAYEVRVSTPTTTTLILREAGAKEPSGDPANKKVGDITLEKAIKIAIVKKKELTAKTIKKALKCILGSAKSIGVTVEGRDPGEVIKEVEDGKYDELLSKYEHEWGEA
ncbi:MAG: 50S ribosomal protein L11 [Desulfurococcaceae archaeon]|nr:50S ribosomal protein L11 [Sulfolobales archaeon]MDW8170824.1 50S ribosomal protein L11 [Desulfurococcaceae archaeon]